MKITDVAVTVPEPKPHTEYTITLVLDSYEAQELVNSLWNGGFPTTDALDNLYGRLHEQGALTPLIHEAKAKSKRELRPAYE